MTTNFSNWFKFDLRRSAAFDDYESVESRMREKLSKDIQTGLRTRIDPGLRGKAAVDAGAVRVKAEGNRFVIHSESQGDILKASSRISSSEEISGVDASSIEDLFEASSGIPIAQRKADGTTGLVYRRIQLENVFREQREKAHQETVKQAVVNAVTNNIATRYEEAFDEIVRENPEEQ